MSEQLKIAVTVCDCSDVVHAGGEPQRMILRQHLEAIAAAKEHEAKYGRPQYVYQSVTFSLVQS